MAKKKAGPINPVSAPDPRFDPASDDENRLAHRAQLGGDTVEFDADSTFSEPKQAESDVQDVVTRMIEEALRHYEENLEPEQKKATEYYRGEPFGDEEDGRSKVVSTDVRDAVEAVLPSLMRIFAGSERPVEFAPDGPEDEEVAEQQTDYINHIVMEENDGFLAHYSAFKDALVRRVGAFKWWVEDCFRVQQETLTGVSLDQLSFLAAQDDVESVEVAGETEDGLQVRLTKKYGDKKFRVGAVPPEEIAWSPDARSLDNTALFVHHRELPVDQIVALVGEEHRDFVESQKGRKRSISSEGLENARRFDDDNTSWQDDSEKDESQQKAVYAEAYVLIDADGDGTGELRLMQCVGEKYKILNGDGKGEIVDDIPFALLTPCPEPHAIVGLGFYDLLKDVQRIKSQVWRGTLDSLAQAIEPRTEVVTGEVNMADLLNPEVNGIIRVRRPGMLREVKHSFVGPDTLPVLAAMDEIRADRTGQTKASEGLDADVLQSTTKSAVSATMTKAQQRTEMIARIFAETGIKRMYRGLLKLVTKHQQRAKIVRLRGRYVEIDPTTWNAEKDVTINVAMGGGMIEDKLAALERINADHMALAQAGAPFVDFANARHLRQKYVELLGFRNVDRFYKPWGAQEQAQYDEAMATNPPPPDANMAIVEVERQKAEAQVQIEQQKLELKRMEIVLQNDRERDRIAHEMALKERELELKFASDINDAQLKAQTDRIRASLDAEVAVETAPTPEPTSEA